jgi:hypothetical protein
MSKKKNMQTKNKEKLLLNAFHILSNRRSPAVFAKNVFEPRTCQSG